MSDTNEMLARVQQMLAAPFVPLNAQAHSGSATTDQQLVYAANYAAAQLGEIRRSLAVIAEQVAANMPK